MRFKNREHAARLLAARLEAYKGQNPLILAVPRGGVPMGKVIAEALGGELDVVLVRKLRAAFEAELAIGAIDESGAVLAGPHADPHELPEEYLREEIRIQTGVLRKRRELYARARPPADPADRIVIIVDDGIATGASMLAAVRSVHQKHPRKIVVAVAVAPAESVARLQPEADETICLQSPDFFFAVGQVFEDFSEVTDEMVMAALASFAPSSAAK